jgi:predicted RNA-binding Zn-ribbon protein involved in translation (DUF1610 family)
MPSQEQKYLLDNNLQDFVISQDSKGIPEFYVSDALAVWAKISEEKFTAGRTLAGVAPTTDQSTPLCPDCGRKMIYVCSYCETQGGAKCRSAKQE